MPLIDRDETWRAIKPFMAGLIDDKVANLSASSGLVVSSHDLGGSRHIARAGLTHDAETLLHDYSGLMIDLPMLYHDLAEESV